MLNVLVVTQHEIVYLDVTHCFYSHDFVTNSLLIQTWQDLIDMNASTSIHVVIIDFPSQIPYKDMIDYCRDNNPDCLVYGIFDHLDETEISEFIHDGAHSFVLRSNLPGLVLSVRRTLAEKLEPASTLPLRKQHPFINSFFEQAIDPIWVKDKRGKYLYINPAGARFIARPISEIIGKYDHDVFPRETAEKIIKSDNYVIQTGKTQVVEDALSNCNEINRVFQAVKTVFRDKTGKAQGLIGTIRDITDRKQAEGIPKGTGQSTSLMLRNIKDVALSFIEPTN